MRQLAAIIVALQFDVRNFVKSEEFALAIRNTDNYYVIATRFKMGQVSAAIDLSDF